MHARRMQRAAELLAQGESCKVVATELEYKSAAHFNRDFTKHFHVSPGRYRKQKAGIWITAMRVNGKQCSPPPP